MSERKVLNVSKVECTVIVMSIISIFVISVLILIIIMIVLTEILSARLRSLKDPTSATGEESSIHSPTHESV